MLHRDMWATASPLTFGVCDPTRPQVLEFYLCRTDACGVVRGLYPDLLEGGCYWGNSERHGSRKDELWPKP